MVEVGGDAGEVVGGNQEGLALLSQVFEEGDEVVLLLCTLYL